MFYNVIYLTAVFGNVVTFLSQRPRQWLYYITLATFFILATFRWEVGCDFYSYRRMSYVPDYVNLWDMVSKYEPGFQVTVYTLHVLGLEFPAINVVASVIFFAGLHAMARRQSDPLAYMVLAFPILILNIGMSAVRQEMAMGFDCFALNAFVDKSRSRFVLWVLVATTFHSSSIAFLALTPFISRSISTGRLVLALLASLPIAFYLARSETAQTYTEMYVNHGDTAAGGVPRAFLLLLTGAAYWTFLRGRWNALSPGDFRLVDTFSVLMMTMLPLTAVSSVMGDRFGYYCVPVELIIQSKSYRLFDRDAAWPLMAAPMFASGLALYIWSLYGQAFLACWNPYQMWWF